MPLAMIPLLALAPAAGAQITVGGHVGVVIPWVTYSGGKTTNQFDAYNIGFPLGVTFKGQGRFAVDLEMIPSVNQTRIDNLVADPGVLYTLNPDSSRPGLLHPAERLLSHLLHRIRPPGAV